MTIVDVMVVLVIFKVYRFYVNMLDVSGNLCGYGVWLVLVREAFYIK